MSTATSISQASDLNKRLEESDPVLFDIIENEKVSKGIIGYVALQRAGSNRESPGTRERGRLSVEDELCLRTIGVPGSNI
jgi:hypothetical protein